MKVCVVGIGYVGLVTASCLSEAGNDVICVDNDERKIEALKSGVIPIYEPGLTEMVARNVKLQRLNFTTDLKEGIDNSLIIFLAVGTPSDNDGSADLSAIFEVVDGIAENLAEYRIIATKSTVPIGTCQKITERIKSQTDTPFDYVSNPEFLKEGAAVEDFMSPDRIIIGSENPPVQELMKQLYSPFMRRNNRIIFMSSLSAELTKYAANTMLASRISFMNQISALCEKVGADVEMVRRGLGSDGRIGSSFLFPGVGFGGSCFPKDIRALIHTGREHGVEMTMAEVIQQINFDQQQRFANRIIEYFADSETPARLGVWGLAFKAKTDDVRESPSVHCVKRLLEAGMSVKAYDPEAAEAGHKVLKGEIELGKNGYDVLENADALVILTDWQEFRNPDLARISAGLKNPVVFDGRNLYDPNVLRKAGIEYHSIGR